MFDGNGYVPCYVTAFRASQERRYTPFLTYVQLGLSVPPLLQPFYVSIFRWSLSNQSPTSKFSSDLLYFKIVFRYILKQRGVVAVLGSAGVRFVFIVTSTALLSYCWFVWSLSSM